MIKMPRVIKNIRVAVIAVLRGCCPCWGVRAVGCVCAARSRYPISCPDCARLIMKPLEYYKN